MVRRTTPENLYQDAYELDCLSFVDDFACASFDKYRDFYIDVPRARFLCTDRGHIKSLRMATPKSSSRWMVTFDSWDGEPGTQFLVEQEEYYKHMDIGVAPTSGSMGRLSMMYVYTLFDLPRHTALNLACEDFLYKNGFGGMAITSKLGETDRASCIDLSSAYVAKSERVPSGTPEHFVEGSQLDDYVTWFARVKVTINAELSLGLFPVRGVNHSVFYPTRPRTYDTFLWREQADAARLQGCRVRVFEGFGWRQFTHTNRLWAEWIYSKRLSAPNVNVEKRVKKTAVSAVGIHGMSRQQYILVGDKRYDPATDFSALDVNAPLYSWVHPELNSNGAIMVHWHHFVVTQTNLALREEALPYAESGRLISIDTDGFFTDEYDEEHRYIKRHSIESAVVEPGTWLWERHHHHEMLGHRIWFSDEQPKRYGTTREEYKQWQASRKK